MVNDACNPCSCFLCHHNHQNTVVVCQDTENILSKFISKMALDQCCAPRHQTEIDHISQDLTGQDVIFSQAQTAGHGLRQLVDIGVILERYLNNPQLLDIPRDRSLRRCNPRFPEIFYNFLLCANVIVTDKASNLL